MPLRRIVRRAVAIVVIFAQLFLVVRAYSADHAFFGFQMFPESSEWQALIERELEDGSRVDVREPWPGGYQWSDLVTGRGLGAPFRRHHADAGLDSTLHFFSAALQWVAENTPADTETVVLTATVMAWRNGAPAAVIRFEARR